MKKDWRSQESNRGLCGQSPTLPLKTGRPTHGLEDWVDIWAQYLKPHRVKLWWYLRQQKKIGKGNSNIKNARFKSRRVVKVGLFDPKRAQGHSLKTLRPCQKKVFAKLVCHNRKPRQTQKTRLLMVGWWLGCLQLFVECDWLHDPFSWLWVLD